MELLGIILQCKCEGFKSICIHPLNLEGCMLRFHVSICLFFGIGNWFVGIVASKEDYFPGFLELGIFKMIILNSGCTNGVNPTKYFARFQSRSCL